MSKRYKITGRTARAAFHWWALFVVLFVVLFPLIVPGLVHGFVGVLDALNSFGSGY